MPKVSVIVPIYNVEKYLRQCLDSIIGQTLIDIEIICINDGSTDSSLGILMEYGKFDSRIRIINKENTGYGNSMNIGLRAAVGEYIGIVESDDFIENNMFETLYQHAVKYGGEVVKSNYIEQGEKNAIFVEPLVGILYGQNFSPRVEEYQQIFYRMPCIWSALYKREFLLEKEIFFNETPGASYQDFSFNFKVLSCVDRLFLLKNAFLHYRIDNVNSSIHSPLKIYCIFDEFDEIYRFVETKINLKIALQFLIEHLKYQYCWVNYKRISDCYKFAFLTRMAEEFSKAEKIGLLKQAYWNKDEWNDMQKLLYDREKFFFERYAHLQKKRMYSEAFLKKLENFSAIYIYGAGAIGKNTANYLLSKDILISGFMVSEMADNMLFVLDKPVYVLADLTVDFESVGVLVAVKEDHQYEIIVNLQKRGFKNIIAMSLELRECLQ